MRPLLIGLLVLVPGIVLACGDDETDRVADAGDAGPPAEDAGHGGHDSATVDAGPPPVRCTEEELSALDLTDGGTLEITFELLANPKQYVNRCATVRAGSNVTFIGGFRQHPLEPAGGDTPNPIPYVEDDQPGDRLVVPMPSPGTFGFQCTFHPAQMFGAIRVVP